MRLYSIFCLFILSTGCQQSDNDLPLKTQFDTIITQTLAADYYEEYLFEASYLTGIVLDFDLMAVTDEQQQLSTPSVALVLKNQTRQISMSFEYFQSDKPYLQITVESGKERWFDEYHDLTQQLNEFELRFDESTVFLKAGDFSHAMGIPFETSLIGIQHASAEITNRVDFIYK